MPASLLKLASILLLLRFTTFAQIHDLSIEELQGQTADVLNSLPSQIQAQNGLPQNEHSELGPENDPRDHALEEWLETIRDQLAWNTADRDLSAAIEGYKELLAMLEDTQASSLRGGEIDQEGLEILAQGIFELGALTLTGIVNEVQPRNISLGLHFLEKASEAGSLEANLALSHRFFRGHDVPQNCSLAFRYGMSVARQYRDAVDAYGQLDPPLTAFLLRDRWAFADFEAPALHSLESVPEVQAESHSDDDGLNILDLFRWDEADQWQFEMLTGASPVHFGRPIEAVIRQAQQGDALAMYEVGFAMLKGITIAKNTTAAQILLLQAHNKGVAAASNALGVLSFHSEGGPNNVSLAEQYFRAGAERGDPDSQFNLGALYVSHHPEKYKESLALFKSAYDDGHWQAPLQLAISHYAGVGTQADCNEAMKYLNEFLMEQAPWHEDIWHAVKALDAGDEWEAVVSFVFLAEQGSSAAQDNLAFLLQSQDTDIRYPDRYNLAFEMFWRASKQIPSALTQAAHLLWEGHAHRLPEGSDKARALDLYDQAVKQSNESEALFCLARAYQQGRGVGRNMTLAEELYRQAIDTAKYSRHALPSSIMLVVLRVERWLKGWHVIWKGGRLLYRFVRRDNAVLTTLIVLLVSVLLFKRARQQQRSQEHN